MPPSPTFTAAARLHIDPRPCTADVANASAEVYEVPRQSETQRMRSMSTRVRMTTLPSATILAIMALRADAAGFQLQEQTASGLGLAYSGMPAAAQDAGTAFWNPAAMTA